MDARSAPSLVLPAPAVYFPPASGRYEVKPGLAALGTDFGNGAADGRLFQIDRHYRRYRDTIDTARAERLSKYYRTDRLGPAGAAAIELIVERLGAEYPAWFHRRREGSEQVVYCALTGETLRLDAEHHLVDVHPAPTPPYADALDALAAQVPEDLVVVRRDGGRDWVAAAHLCAPNHWAAEDKIGHDFTAVHAPVAGIERINRNARALVDTMIDKGPYVRFVWGLATDERLNHHPEPAPGTDPLVWQGRRFDPHTPALYLRVERQVTWGLPAVDAALFAIRTYLTDCRTLSAAHRARLASAIRSMSDEALIYKGLAGQRDAVLGWLERAHTGE